VNESTLVNRLFWDERAPVHAASPDYGLDRYVDDPSFLGDCVRFDRPLLGDIGGLRGVHLQCHIGTDTISLSRLGARMTGLDFSAPAIAEARRVAAAAGDDVRFVEADVASAIEVLGPGQFDLVYTGIGALCWLPDIQAWARTVADLLRPGGRLFLRECHPILWAMDEGRSDGILAVRYPYFETAEPLVDDEPGTYVQTDASLEHTVSHSWNHGIGEIISALLDTGLELTGLVEHRSLPWNALAEGVMVADADGEWRLREGTDRLPLSYTLQAVKS
jgi:SAM-dependent methyltransferase